MAFSSAQRTGFGVCLVLTILLVGLHLAVAGTGHEYYKNNDNVGILVVNGTNYSERDFNQLAAFWIIAASLTFFISIALLVAICANKFTVRVRHILASLNLCLEFAIAVTVSIAASRASNLRDLLYNKQGYGSISSLDAYYRVAIADAVITFVLELVYLVLIYLGTLEQIEHTVEVDIIIPPPTADRLQ